MTAPCAHCGEEDFHDPATGLCEECLLIEEAEHIIDHQIQAREMMSESMYSVQFSAKTISGLKSLARLLITRRIEK